QVRAAPDQFGMALVLLGNLLPRGGDAVDLRGRHGAPVVGDGSVRAQAMHDDVAMLLELVGDVRTLAVVEPEDLLLLAHCAHDHPVCWTVAGHDRSPNGIEAGCGNAPPSVPKASWSVKYRGRAATCRANDRST